MSKKEIELIPANQMTLIKKAAALLKYLAEQNEKFLGKSGDPHYSEIKKYFDQSVAFLENSEGCCAGISFTLSMSESISRSQQDSKEKTSPIHNRVWFGEVRQLLARWTPETHHLYNENQQQSMLLFIQFFISAQKNINLFGQSVFLAADPSAWVVSKDKPFTFKQIGEVFGFYHHVDLTKILTEILKKDRFIFLSSTTHVGVLYINDNHQIELFDSNQDYEGVIYPNVKAVVDYFSTKYPHVRADVLLPITLWAYTGSPKDNSFPSVGEIAKLCQNGELAYSPEIPGYFDGVASIHIVARKNKDNKNYLHYWSNYLKARTSLSAAYGTLIAVCGNLEKFNSLDQNQRSEYLNAIDHRGQNMLIHAILANQINFASILLEEKINLNIQDKFGWTALMYAAQYPKSDIFAKLLSKGADPFIRDLDGKSIFNIFIKKENKLAEQALVSYLLPDGETLLMQAVLKKDLDFIQFLKAPQINVQDELEKTALIYATISGYQKGVDELLAVKNIEVDLRDCFSRTALIYAAQQGHNEIFAKLLAAGCDPFVRDISGKSTLQYVLESRNEIQMLSLLSYRFSDGRTLLMQAIIKNDLESIRILISLATATEINARNHNGRTALFYAAITGNQLVVELLLAANADLTIQDVNGKKAIDYAKKTEIIQSLLLPGGKTALMLACQDNDLKKINQLLLANIDVDVKDDKGRTALFYAAAFGNKQAIELLLTANANPLIEDHQKKSALNYALDYKHTHLYYLLCDAEMTAGEKQAPVTTSSNHFTVFSKPSPSINIPMAIIDNNPTPIVIATLA